MERDLSERENDFVRVLSDHVKEEDARPIERDELYALTKARGFSEREVYRYAMELNLQGYLKAQPILGGKIASISLTARGIEYAKNLKKRET
jgi:hypothetical protein